MKDFMEQPLWLNPWHLFIPVLNKGGLVKNSLCRILKLKIIPYMSDNLWFFPLQITFLANNKNIKRMLVTAKGVCLMLTMCEIALNPKYKYNLPAHVNTSWSAK